MQFQANNFTSTLSSIPEGKDGILYTMKLMRSLVKQYKKSLAVRTLAVQIVNPYYQKDWNAEIKALQSFVRDRIRYTRDIRDVETIQTPDVTLRLKSGDCDDKSTLLASLLESIGHPTRFIAIGFQPDQFEHVYVETRIGTKWIPLETTEPVNIGWQPKNIQARMYVYN